MIRTLTLLIGGALNPSMSHLYGEGNAANYLTISATGRVAKQPELKFCAVALAKVPGERAAPPAFLNYVARETFPKPAQSAVLEDAP